MIALLHKNNKKLPLARIPRGSSFPQMWAAREIIAAKEGISKKQIIIRSVINEFKWGNHGPI
jgi:hypothetical protein